MVKNIPTALVVIRLLLGPIILIIGILGAPGQRLFALLLLGLLSDIFDGIVARRLNVDTEWLRRLDSFVDRIFYGFIILLTLIRFTPTVQTWWVLIALLLFSELVRFIYDFQKFGRQAAYHMWLAKLWGLSLLLGFSELFLTGTGGVFFVSALILGVVSNLEGLTASIILSSWQHDIPTVYHAYQIEQAAKTIQNTA